MAFTPALVFLIFGSYGILLAFGISCANFFYGLNRFFFKGEIIPMAFFIGNFGIGGFGIPPDILKPDSINFFFFISYFYYLCFSSFLGLFKEIYLKV